ncbi:MAG: hypothetical protein ACOYOL_06710 [Chthoniobacterales bacterium]
MQQASTPAIIIKPTKNQETKNPKPLPVHGRDGGDEGLPTSDVPVDDQNENETHPDGQIDKRKGQKHPGCDGGPLGLRRDGKIDSWSEQDGRQDNKPDRPDEDCQQELNPIVFSKPDEDVPKFGLLGPQRLDKKIHEPGRKNRGDHDGNQPEDQEPEPCGREHPDGRHVALFGIILNHRLRYLHGDLDHARDREKDDRSQNRDPPVWLKTGPSHAETLSIVNFPGRLEIPSQAAQGGRRGPTRQ